MHSIIVESQLDAVLAATTSAAQSVSVRADAIPIRGLFPDTVFVRAVAFERTDAGAPPTRSPMEIQHQRIVLPADLSAAAPKRVATFIAGRHCAFHALGQLGVNPLSVERGKVGSPAWPNGIVGSIAHTDDMAIAAVARSSHYRALGVDCERIMTAETAANVREAVAAELLDPNPQIVWGDASDELLVTAVFSAKETLYKGLHPIAGVFFGFDDASVVRGHLAEGWLELRLNRDLPEGFASGSLFNVRIVRQGGALVTGLLLDTKP